MVCVCSDGTKFGRFLGPASRSISTSAMDVSTDVKSLVRGWLQASPNIGRVKLAPSPLASAFSPRPDRLGLGATPPLDVQRSAYRKQLEKRVQRKVLGKRRKQDVGSDFESTTQCKREPDSSDEECSRSNSVHKPKCITSAAAVVGSVSNGGLLNKRKRRRRKKAPISVSPVSPAPKVVEEFEDPLPRRRKDLLRGGSSGVQLDHDCPTLEPRITHPAMELYTKKSKSCVPSTTHSKTTCTELECDFEAAAAAAVKKQEEKSNYKESRNFEPTNDLSSTCGATVKEKHLRGRSRRVRQMRGHRTQSLPWSRLPQNARQRHKLCVRLERLLQ